MRVLLFIALFVWNTAIRAQTAKLTDMGTYWMFKSYVSIAMPDGNFLYQYPSYMFPLPKTLKWYTEIPGKLMFILDKKQTIFVEIINTEILNDTTYILLFSAGLILFQPPAHVFHRYWTVLQHVPEFLCNVRFFLPAVICLLYYHE